MAKYPEAGPEEGLRSVQSLAAAPTQARCSPSPALIKGDLREAPFTRTSDGASLLSVSEPNGRTWGGTEELLKKHAL